MAAGLLEDRKEVNWLQRLRAREGTMAVIKIKLTGENHEDVDMVCGQIKAICDETGVDLRGPIPLPTRKLVVQRRKSPDGEGAETWDHWEMRIQATSGTCDISSQGRKGPAPSSSPRLPDSVTIELSLRHPG